MFNNFLKSRSGNFAVVTAIAMMPAMAAVGLSVDYTNITRVRTANKMALDAAMLAASRQPDSTTAKTEADRIYAANDGKGTLTNFVYTPPATPAGKTLVSASAAFTMKLTFGGVIGLSTAPVTVAAGASAKPVLSSGKVEIVFASGQYNKVVSFWGRTKGQTTYTERARITYTFGGNVNTNAGTSVTQIVNGTSVTNGSVMSFNNTDSIYLKMVNTKSPKSQWSPGVATVQSNVPAQTNYFYMDNVRYAAGLNLDFATLLPCGVKKYIQVEDSGGGTPDIGFYLTGQCVVSDASPVTMTQ